MSGYKDKISFAILVGGKSSRMGRDKSQMKIDGNMTFLEKLDCELGDIFGAADRYISVNDTQNIEIKGYETVKDIAPDIGPLGGIFSVLTQTSQDYVLFVACDMPGLTKEAVTYLLHKWEGEDMCIASTDKGRQPLVGIYSKACILPIINQIERGLYKPVLLLELVNSKVVDMREFEECFVNINTVDEYKRYWNGQKV